MAISKATPVASPGSTGSPGNMAWPNRAIIMLFARWAPMANSSPPRRMAVQAKAAPMIARATRA